MTTTDAANANVLAAGEAYLRQNRMNAFFRQEFGSDVPSDSIDALRTIDIDTAKRMFDFAYNLGGRNALKASVALASPALITVARFITNEADALK